MAFVSDWIFMRSTSKRNLWPHADLMIKLVFLNKYQMINSFSLFWESSVQTPGPHVRVYVMKGKKVKVLAHQLGWHFQNYGFNICVQLMPRLSMMRLWHAACRVNWPLMEVLMDQAGIVSSAQLLWVIDLTAKTIEYSYTDHVCFSRKALRSNDNENRRSLLPSKNLIFSYPAILH